MKYLKKFETQEEFQTVQATLDLPNVSLTIDNYNVHYNPYVKPTHEYVEIGGIKWATMNVGANSVTDAGFYFQWGDTQGYTAAQVGSGEGKKYFSVNDCIYYNDGSYTKYNDEDGLTTLQASDDAATAAWGGNWRMPTSAELLSLRDAVNTAWTTSYEGSGVAGLVLTSKVDSSKKLFFPACGLAYNGSVSGVGSNGLYWSSSLSADDAYFLYFVSYNVDWGNLNDRYYGFPVRGILDE